MKLPPLKSIVRYIEETNINNIKNTMPCEEHKIIVKRGNVLADIESYLLKCEFHPRADTIAFMVTAINGEKELAIGSEVTRDVMSKYWEEFSRQEL